jgi:hypothetical protein
MTPSSLSNGEKGEGLFVGPSPLLYKLTIKQATPLLNVLGVLGWPSLDCLIW